MKALLLMYLGGEAVGGACADLLCGKVTPSGKLAETWPLALEDTPCHGCFSEHTFYTQYRESVFVGYRWYDTVKQDVAYPFGYGLSYTDFNLDNLTTDSNTFEPDGTLRVTVDVTNTGKIAGAEVVQLYVAKASQSVYRPAKELKGFEKVFLQPGETKTVSFVLDSRSFAYYCASQSDWVIEEGEYSVLIGSSCNDIHASATITAKSVQKNAPPNRETPSPAYFHVSGAKPPFFTERDFATLLDNPLPNSKDRRVKPYYLNSTIGELQHSFLGRLLLKQIIGPDKDRSDGDDLSKMIDSGLLEFPLRAMSLTGKLKPAQVRGLVDLLNGHFMKGIRKLK